MPTKLRIFAVVLAGAILAGVMPASSRASETQMEPAVRFTDVTHAAGIHFVQTIGDDEMTNIVEATGVGCGFLDYDCDGWMDIYLVNGCWQAGLSDAGLPANEKDKLAKATDHLYRNRGDGTFEDVTIAAGLAKPAFGMGVVVADYDADSDPDIYITNYGPNFFYRNNGDGTFTEVAETIGARVAEFSVGAVFFDYDRDGWLDLYVGNYLEYDPDYAYYYAPDGFPGPLAYTGQQDRLLRGNKDGVFTDVTENSGIEVKPLGKAMGVGALDYDRDGLPDIFVSNDAMENYLFHNNGDGKFEDRALLSSVAFGESGQNTSAMAVESADYDNDGLLDLFVPDARYSCLYHNEGGGSFEDLCVVSGIAAASGQYNSWGCVFADFDLNGTIDLYVSNGDMHHLEAHEDLLFLGDGTGIFVDISERTGEWSKEKFVSRGVAGADFDNDGDIDILVNNLNNRAVLLRHDSPRQSRHWLGVQLEGIPPNRDALGAVVRATVGQETMTRQRVSAGSYLSQHDPRLYFGVGENQKIDQLEVTWPNGARQVVDNVPSDTLLRLKQVAAVKQTPEQ